MFSPINSAIDTLVNISKGQPQAEVFNSIIPNPEEFAFMVAQEIAAMSAFVEFDPAPAKHTIPQELAARKPGMESWRPALNPIDVITADLTEKEQKLVKVFESTRKSMNQYKLPAIQEWDFVQAGRALAQLAYWQYECTFSTKGETWILIQHKHTGKKIAVSLDGSNNFTMTCDYDRFETHPLVAPGLHVTKINGIYWVYGETQKNASKLAQAGGRFSKLSPVGMPAWGFRALPESITKLVRPNRPNKYHMLAAMLLGDRVVIERGEFSKLAGEQALLDGYRRETWRVAGYDYRDYPRPVFGVICPACGELKNGFVRDICVDCDADMQQNVA
jgi:hypothetical protein